jgi:hypothetical protein
MTGILVEWRLQAACSSDNQCETYDRDRAGKHQDQVVPGGRSILPLVLKS